MSPSPLLPTIRALPGVDAAAGSIGGDFRHDALTLTADGGRLDTARARASASASTPSSRASTPSSSTRAPGRAARQIVIDAGTATSSTSRSATRSASRRRPRPQPYRHRHRHASATSTRSAAPRSPSSTSRPRARCSARTASTPSRSPRSPASSVDALVRQIEPLLPATPQVKTPRRAPPRPRRRSRSSSPSSAALLAFGGIALFVGAFVIFNTLSITVAQRSRELATLRTLGASRRQVLRSVIAERRLIGLAASLVGLAPRRYGLAKGLSALFGARRASTCRRPDRSSRRARSSSRSPSASSSPCWPASCPAIRATRVPPIAAVREGAVLPPARLARYTPLSRSCSRSSRRAAGHGLLADGLDGDGPAAEIRRRHARPSSSASAMLSSRLVRPIAALVGWPSRGSAARPARSPARTRSATPAARPPPPRP